MQFSQIVVTKAEIGSLFDPKYSWNDDQRAPLNHNCFFPDNNPFSYLIKLPPQPQITSFLCRPTPLFTKSTLSFLFYFFNFNPTIQEFGYN